MNTDNILDSVEKAVHRPFYTLKSIRYLKYTVSIGLFWALALSVMMIFQLEVQFIGTLIFLFLLFISFLGVVGLGSIGLYYLISSYKKGEERDDIQRNTLLVLGALVGAFFIASLVFLGFLMNFLITSN